MKKLLIIILTLCLPLCNCLAQQGFSLKINAGSIAPFGKNQYLTIDAKGNCDYRQTRVNKGTINASTFIIPQNEVKELASTIKQAGFFKLDKLYKTADVEDGSGMYITVTEGGKTHEVRFVNTHTEEADKIVNKLNTILSAHHIKIFY